MALTPDHQALLEELAAIAHDLRDSGRFMRQAVSRLIETEEELIKTNRLMQIMTDRVDRAITTALRMGEKPEP
jgi:hypothetical protein